ncbi:hypothetical protein [Pseudomonas sp. BN411]|uniref:hypothetical protein n=1 Tax=Pseudomonas sp. BN411 TaxID=2567887 RepID=UPI002458A0A8|nr:hypothetical protein [Pseudomonas sp. BN411]MDH4564098.1 hypothetical protein [Pseudomonas sp. BN411]
MARRRPLTFQTWALGLVGTIITALVVYYARVAIIEQMGQRQIAHTQAALQKRQEQQAQQVAARAQPALQRQHRQTMSSEEAKRQAAADSRRAVEAQRARIDEQRQHDAAWESFYKPMRGCDNWQSDSHMVECQNHKLRAKREFEQKWAAGEFNQPKG